MRFLAAVFFNLIVRLYSVLPAPKQVEFRKAVGAVSPNHGKGSEPPEKKTVGERFEELVERMSLRREQDAKPRTVFLGEEIVGIQPEFEPLVLSDDPQGRSFGLGGRLVTRPVVCEDEFEVRRVREANADALQSHTSDEGFPLVLSEDELVGLVDESTLAQTSDLGHIIIDPGSPGISYTGGLPDNREHNSRFHPVQARGLQWDHGEFHELLVEMSPFRRGWLSINHVLSQMLWSVEAPEIPDDHPLFDELTEQAKEQAEFVKRMLLDNLYGGWKKLLREANYSAVGGFSIFVEVWRGPDDEDAGGIRKLSFRFPKQVKEWITHPRTGELLAVVFTEPEGGEYTVRAENLLLYSFEGLGNDFEGMALTRSVVIWADVLKVLTELEAVAAEKWGNAWAWASRQNEAGAPFSDSERTEIRDLIRDAIAEDDPVITLPDNTKIELTSPTGVVPNFDTAKRFALERLVEIWKSEASLIALGSTGAYSARESAVDEQVAFAEYFASLISDALNGANNTPYTGTIKKMVDLRFGGPVLPGRYPSITHSLGQREDPERFNKIIQAVSAGLVEANDEVKKHTHELLELPPPEAPSESEREPTSEALASAADVQPSDAVGALRIALTASDEVDFEPLVLSDFDADEATAFLDEAESSLAAALIRIMREHREFWRKAADQERRSNEFSAQRIEQLAEEARELILNQYVEAAISALIGVAVGGASSLLSQIGAGGGDDVMKSVREGSTALRLKARALGEEVFNRVNGMMIDRFTAFARGESTTSLPILEKSTVESIASKGVSTAYNAGRDTVAEELSKVAPDGAKSIIAERSSVLDSNTCSTCRDLDGVRVKYGSARYYDLSPPNKCEGWDRCRCIWTFIMPDELVGTIKDL